MISEAKIREFMGRLQFSAHEFEDLDAKQTLSLSENGQKAEFVKDIVAMANNSTPSYIIIGLEDGSFEPIGALTNHYRQTDLNQILAGKIEPRITVQYDEITLEENEYAVISINGENPPYFVSRDIIHGINDTKKKSIFRGMSFIRNGDSTDGIVRSDIDSIFERKNATLLPYVKKTNSLPNNIYSLDLRIFNNSNILAELISLRYDFKDVSITKCPQTTHKHVQLDNSNIIGPIIFEPSVLHSRTKEILGNINISTDNIDNVVILVTVSAKNVRRKEYSIRVTEE